MIGRLERRATAWLRNSAIKYRLINSFILLSLLPLLVSGYISYAESSRAIEEKTRLFVTEVTKQVAKNVRLQMAQIEANSEALVLSDPVQASLAHYVGDGPAGQGRARATTTKILLDAYGSFEHISEKYFLDRDKRILDPQVFAQLGRGVVEFATQTPSLKGRPYWGALDTWGGQRQGRHSIALLRDIYLKADNRLAGSLFLGIEPAHFASVFDDVDLGKDSALFIFDTYSGQIIIRPAAQAAFAAPGALAREVRASLRRGAADGFVSYAEPAQGRFLAAYSQIPGTAWFVVGAIPHSNLLAEARSVRDQIVLIGLLCFVACILCAYLISRSISAPLEQLVGTMKQAEGGDYATRAASPGKDELTVLARQFNDMAGRIGRQHEQLERRVLERTRELEQANRKLAELSITDGLTGIANRRRFDEMLAAELGHAAELGQPLALLMLDVDFFKSYNDHYGHQQGDACLRAIGRLLHAHTRRASDLAARYGGEEFVLLGADTDCDSALGLAERIRAGLAALAMPHQLSPHGHVSASIGVAILRPGQNCGAEALIRLADQAMYRAKQEGRNRVVLAD